MAGIVFVNKNDKNIKFIADLNTIIYDCLADNNDYEIEKLDLTEEETKVKDEQEKELPATDLENAEESTEEIEEIEKKKTTKKATTKK